VSDQSEFDRLWGQAVEQHIADMSDTDFSALVQRTRRKPTSTMTHRELQEQIARKSAVAREMTHSRANGGGPRPIDA
jgi:hypothetical protein